MPEVSSCRRKDGLVLRLACEEIVMNITSYAYPEDSDGFLDVETEKLFLERLSSQTYGKTIIIVTHKQEICKYVSDVIKINFLRDADS